MTPLDEALNRKTAHVTEIHLTARTGFVSLVLKMNTKDLTKFHVIHIQQEEAVTEIRPFVERNYHDKSSACILDKIINIAYAWNNVQILMV